MRSANMVVHLSKEGARFKNYCLLQYSLLNTSTHVHVIQIEHVDVLNKKESLTINLCYQMFPFEFSINYPRTVTKG